MVPIWKRPKNEVKDEDYNEFYKSTFHDFEDPARTVSFHAEGTLEYDALLFIPSRAPFAGPPDTVGATWSARTVNDNSRAAPDTSHAVAT